jgi:serine/threonine protein kinase/WD40 repeat protein
MSRQIAELAASEAKKLFMKCREVDGDARDAILSGVNHELASQVRDLIAAVERGDVIDRVFNIGDAQQLDATQDSQPGESQPPCEQFSLAPSEAPGVQIGNYKLLEQIGEGGMGTVFMAQQTQPVKRRVAIKIVKPGMDSRQVLARFEAERQALALMDHLNIARIFDGGTTDSGRPYFVMELVKGIPLTDFCQHKKLSVRERLKLFIDLCRGVQHAHQRGVIHRDLKPSNVLVTLHDGRPVVKIIDFGIAKATSAELTDKTLFTQFAAMVGTPLYMSPEQAELSGLDVDTRCDVYSLGVLLYEILTNTTPFDRETLKRKGLDEVRRMIRETEPPRPSHRISTIKASDGETTDSEKHRELKKTHSILTGELDWITMRSLEKDRERRYQSASELADDIQRYLNGDAVLACPPSLSYQVGRYARRHRILLISTGLVLCTALIGMGASLMFAKRARDATGDAVAAKQVAENEAARARAFAEQRDAAAEQMSAEMIRAKRAEELANVSRRETQAALYRENVRAADAQVSNHADTDAIKALLRHVPDKQADDIRSWEWYYLLGKTRISDRGWYAQFVGESAEWFGDGKSILTTGRIQDSKPSPTGLPKGRVWDSKTGLLLQELNGWFGRARLNPMRPEFATNFHATNLYGSQFGTGVIQILDLADQRQVSVPVPGVTNPGPVEWNRDGDRFATGSDHIFVFRRTGGEWQIEHQIERADRVGGWSTGDRYFVANGKMPGIQVYNGGTLKLEKEIQGEGKMPYRWTKQRLGQWHPQQLWFAYPVDATQVAVLDVESGELVTTLHLAQGYRDLRFSPDGNRLAVAGSEGLIEVWRVSDWNQIDRIDAHDTFVETVSWSPDSKRILSMGIDGFCAIWSFDQLEAEHVIQLPNHPDLKDFQWIDDTTIRYGVGGERISTRRITEDSDATIIPLPSDENWHLTSTELALRFTRENEDRFVELFDLNMSSKKRVRVPRLGTGRRPWSLSPNEEKLAVATASSEDYTVGVVELVSGAYRSFGVNGVRRCNDCVWSPDGKRIAFAGTASGLEYLPAIIILDVDSGEKLLEKSFGKLNFGNHLQTLDWNRDGNKIVVGLDDGTCYVIDSRTGVTEATARPVAGGVRYLDWHPYHDRIVTGSGAGKISVWDSNTGESLLTFDAGEPVRDVRWSPGGFRLAAQLASGRIRIWDASEGYRRSESNWVEEHQRERFRKSAYSTFADAFALADRGEWNDALDLLRPYVVRDHSSGISGESHAWIPDPVAYFYFWVYGLKAKSAGDNRTALDAFKRAASLGLRNREAVKSLSQLIADGLVVEDFEVLVDNAYAAWSEDFGETLRAIDLNADTEYVQRKRRELATVFDDFASIYRRGKLDLDSVVRLREQAVEYDPENAEYHLRLAADYFTKSHYEKAVENAEKALLLRPGWSEAVGELQKYRDAVHK